MNYTALGNRIRECRVKHKFTQLQVAEQLLFSQKHIGNIERGSARPSIDLLVRISNTLNVSLDYLLQDSLTHKTADSSAIFTEVLEQYLEHQKMEMIQIQNHLEYLKKFPLPDNTFHR